MKNTRAIGWLAATALLFGCSAGVKPTPLDGGGGTGPGAGGTTGSGGTTGTGGTGTSGSTGFDGSFDISVNDVRADGVCSATMTAAEPVPLDLYVLMDASLSMNEMTTAGTSKWTDVRNALKTFFESQSSAGLGVGLKFFPGVQSSAPATCTGDGPDTACGTFGPCDRRKTCVGSAQSTMSVSPLCVDASTCGTSTSITCSLIQDCGTAGYCAKGPTAATTACTGCNTFAGYCHLRDRCDAAYYATPDVAVGMLDGTNGGQAAMLNTALTAKSPAGYTPTGPALTGALMFARQRITAMPTHRVAVVLVTDGLPGGFLGSAGTGFPPAECAPNSIAATGSDTGIAPLLSGAMGAGGSPPVPTFVIGVFAPGQSAQTAQTNLDMLAKAGQKSTTATAVIIDTGSNVATALQTALKQVQSKAIACEYKIPSTGVDPGKVNVSFTSGSGAATTIGHAMLDGTDGSGCDARGGWYYDSANPATTPPTKITACPASCSMFQTDLNGHVDVVLGCPTISVD
jgi:hypothetical protein